jgi:hypothetical protein
VSHDVVLTGFRLNTGEPPAKVLERVLGLEPAKARAATQRFPVILARTSLERADQLADILREAGAMVDVREAASVARPTTGQIAQVQAPPPAAPLPPSAPAPGIRAVPTPLGATSPLGLPTIAGMPPLPGTAAQGSAMPAPAPAMFAAPAARPASEPAARPSAASMPFTLSAPPGLAAPQPAPPALSIAQPENDWNMQALAPVLPPVEALEPEPPPAAPKMTAYQLGDLQLDLGKKPAPASAPAPSRDEGPEAELGGLAPGAPGDALELDTSAMPAPAQRPSPAPVPAASPSPQAATAEAPSFGGMQSFGDGFDDMNQQGEASLELDRDASWLNRQKSLESPAKPAPAAPPAQDEYGEAPLPRRQPPKIVAPKPLTFKERLQYALYEVFATAKVVLVHTLAVLAMAAVTGAAVAYGRSPDALFELIGLEAPPAPPNELRIPVVSPLAIPPLLREARIHPLLRLVPEQLSLEVATALRARVPGWHHVEVKWPRPDDVRGHHVECLLVEHQKGDKAGREAAVRVHALLRTGIALDLPPEVQKALRDNMLTRRDEQGLKKRFTQLCLAL